MNKNHSHLHTIRLAALCLLVCGATAHAGRPLATEDAGVLERGDCEVESFAGRARVAGEPSSLTQSLQFGCGVGWSTQLALAAVRTREAGQTDRVVLLSGKTTVVQIGEGQLTLAASWDRDALQALAVLSRPLAEAWTLHANLGHLRDRVAAQRTTGWAIAIEHRSTDRLDLMAEAFGDDRDRYPWLQFGLRWALLPERWFVDTSWGRQGGPLRATAFTIGTKIGF
jgi:hypothetical protein